MCRRRHRNSPWSSLRHHLRRDLLNNVAYLAIAGDLQNTVVIHSSTASPEKMAGTIT
jgi:hypothetical protein